LGSRMDLVEPISDATAKDNQTLPVHAVTGSPRTQTWPITTTIRRGFAPSPNDI